MAVVNPPLSNYDLFKSLFVSAIIVIYLSGLGFVIS